MATGTNFHCLSLNLLVPKNKKDTFSKTCESTCLWLDACIAFFFKKIVPKIKMTMTREETKALKSMFFYISN